MHVKGNGHGIFHRCMGACMMEASTEANARSQRYISTALFFHDRYWQVPLSSIGKICVKCLVASRYVLARYFYVMGIAICVCISPY